MLIPRGGAISPRYHGLDIAGSTIVGNAEPEAWR
jgi:hypothetical protein